MTDTTERDALRKAASLISELLVSTLKEATDFHAGPMGPRGFYYIWEEQALDWLREQWERDPKTPINDWTASIVRGRLVMDKSGLRRATKTISEQESKLSQNTG